MYVILQVCIILRKCHKVSSRHLLCGMPDYGKSSKCNKPMLHPIYVIYIQRIYSAYISLYVCCYTAASHGHTKLRSRILTLILLYWIRQEHTLVNQCEYLHLISFMEIRWSFRSIGHESDHVTHGVGTVYFPHKFSQEQWVLHFVSLLYKGSLGEICVWKYIYIFLLWKFLFSSRFWWYH